jgi:predicted glycogen debranching enzyme
MTTSLPTRALDWTRIERSPEALIGREWLVTNGLGGYSSGTISGVISRRYHGILVAALPAPFGRMVMWSHLLETIRFSDGRRVAIGGEEHAGELHLHGADYLREFRLEAGLPVWTYEVEGTVIEKRVLMPHMQNTVHVSYRLLHSQGPVRLELRPAFQFRHYETAVDAGLGGPYQLKAVDDHYEISSGADDLPPLRMRAHGPSCALTYAPSRAPEVIYRIEQSRGYACEGALWSPGYFKLEIADNSEVTLVGSTESWDVIDALPPRDAVTAELARRARLQSQALPAAQSGPAAELVMAADQFIITPAGRSEEAARARAAGDEVRTVIAGYHWFTDWGRDTMISLEGLTLMTGRWIEAGYIIRTFAHYVSHGLIPNMFPDGEKEGLYHTSDATLWFFHAVERYVRLTGDTRTLRLLLPVFIDIAEHHLRGTLFNIHVDPEDGLLCQGAKGYQLTWMDAKMGDWVVTPRRGKAVEINALWYNALSLLAAWLREAGDSAAAEKYASAAARAREAFNLRFQCGETGHLYDVVDGENGDDPACRPNQLFAISLDHPVLERAYWKGVIDIVRQELLTPVGLRSLARNHPEYRPTYSGDLRSRDGAYHQGTVWSWLIGPFVDAWLKLHPEDKAGARRFLVGLIEHLNDAGVGTVSEVFDADEPHFPRGCMAQAWGVAELLRCWVKTEDQSQAFGR